MLLLSSLSIAHQFGDSCHTNFSRLVECYICWLVTNADPRIIFFRNKPKHIMKCFSKVCLLVSVLNYAPNSGLLNHNGHLTWVTKLDVLTLIMFHEITLNLNYNHKVDPKVISIAFMVLRSPSSPKSVDLDSSNSAMLFKFCSNTFIIIQLLEHSL